MTSMESNDSNAVEVDGIRFETLVPERVVTIPNRNGAKIRLQFGLCVTNQTPTPHRFIFFYLLPELLGANGQAIQRDYARNATKAPKSSDVLLAMPGERLSFLLDAHLFWQDYKLQLAGDDGTGGFWSFKALKPGSYQIRFTYRRSSPIVKIYYGESIEDVWIGLVSTPLVEFRLVQP